MTPLPSVLGSSRELIAWRIDRARHAQEWDSGEGSFRVGGRWNERGTRAVYCSLDPSTAILEVAARQGLPALDAVPHVLTSLRILKPRRVKVVRTEDLPDASWLTPGLPSAEQQVWGEEMLARHAMIVLPSAVSRHSWNLVFSPSHAAQAYVLAHQEPFILDPRLQTKR